MTAAHDKAPVYLQCTGKEQYSSAQVAQKVVRRRMKRWRKHAGKLERPLQAYRCRHCGFFHIGGFGK